jgi:hypothetical protein
MKRSLVGTALVLCSLSPAFATTHYEMTWHDTTRSHGPKRSNWVSDVALDSCYSQTGLSREAAATRRFKNCMKSRGYQWVSTKLVQDPPGKANDGSFIDPDTGMSCRNFGGASICDPPQGTVHYRNRHGLDCTRTGILSVCTSF